MDLLDDDLDAINLVLEDDAPSSRHGRIKVRPPRQAPLAQRNALAAPPPASLMPPDER